MTREQAINYLKSSGFNELQIIAIEEALRTRYTIYNVNFPDIPIRTFRKWEDANDHVRFLANSAGYPIEDFKIMEESK